MLHDWIAGIIIILRSVFRAVLWNGWAPEVPNIFNSTFFNPFIVLVWFFYLSILTNYWWRTVNLINYKNRKSFESNEESTVFIWQIADPAGNILKGTQQNNPESFVVCSSGSIPGSEWMFKDMHISLIGQRTIKAVSVCYIFHRKIIC